MPNINIDNYDKMIQMLKDFSGNGSQISSVIDEANKRNIFITNFIDCLSQSNLELSTVIDSINYITKNIVEYNIPIIDLYQHFKTNIITFDDINYFFNNYFSFLDNSEYEIQKIYLLLCQDTSIADLLNQISLNKINNTNFYIKPKFKCSYKKSSEYFVSLYDALEDFYKIKITTKLPDLENIELKNLLSDINNSYINKSYDLLQITNELPHYNQLLQIFNVQHITNIQQSEDIKTFLLKNFTKTDIQGILKKVAKKLYNLYIQDLSNYQNANQKLLFDISTYIPKLQINQSFRLNEKIDDFLIDAMIIYLQNLSENNLIIPEFRLYVLEIFKARWYIEELEDEIIRKNPRFERSQ